MLKAGRGLTSSASKAAKSGSGKGNFNHTERERLVGKVVTIVSKQGAALAERVEEVKAKLPANRQTMLKKMIDEQRKRLNALKQSTHKLVLEVVRESPEFGFGELRKTVERIDIVEPTFTDAVPGQGTFPGQRIAVLPYVDNSKAIAAARKAGESVKATILARADMLTAEVAAKRVGKSRQSINNQRIAGKLIGLSFGEERFRYPEWQFHDNVYGRPLTQVLKVLEREGPWEKWRFFTTENGMLAGKTPADALMSGNVPLERVVRAATAFARE